MTMKQEKLFLINIKKNLNYQVIISFFLCDIMYMKIFLIGFNKCGTTSFYEYFKNNEIKSYHPGVNGGENLNLINKNFINNKLILEGLDYDFYCDLDIWWPKCKYDYNNGIFQDINDYSNMLYTHVKIYKYLDKQYPNSKFILNIRDKDNWIKSRKNHGNPKYIDWFKKFYNVNNDKLIIERWEKEWDIHINDVKKYFKKKPDDLLIYDIENDDVSKLNNFMEKYIQLKNNRFPIKNKTK